MPLVTLGSTVSGSFGATTCQNLLGFALAQQFLVSVSSQTSYAIQFTSTVPAALVPLTVGSAAAPALTATGSAALVVVDKGSFGFLLTAAALTTGSYTVSTQRNPDPRNSCATTYVTMDVAFNTALTASCTSRDILIVPLLASNDNIEISVTTPGRPVLLELRNAVTGALLSEVTANPSKRTGKIDYTNGSSPVRLLLRVSGSNLNDLIPIKIEK